MKQIAGIDTNNFKLLLVDDIPLNLILLEKMLRLVQQVKDAPDAAADAPHALALAGVIGGKGRVQRPVDIAHGFCRHRIIPGTEVHLHHSLFSFLPEQAFQRRVLLHGALVAAAQENAVEGALHLFGKAQLAVLTVLQVVPAQQHFHLCRLPDALRLAHHPAPAQGARHPLTLAG